jgi:hypothetical protein
MWQWKGGPGAPFWRFVLTSLIAVLAFLVTAWILPGLNFNSFAIALMAVILIAPGRRWHHPRMVDPVRRSTERGRNY